MSFSPLNHVLCRSSVVNSPQPVYLVSARPMTFHVYRCNSCSSSLTLPTLCPFQVPTLNSSLHIYFEEFLFPSIVLFDSTLRSNGGRGRFYPRLRPIRYMVSVRCKHDKCFNGKNYLVVPNSSPGMDGRWLWMSSSTLLIKINLVGEPV